MKKKNKNKLTIKSKSAKPKLTMRLDKVRPVKTTKASKIVKPIPKSVSLKSKASYSVEDMINLITEAIQFKFKGDKTEPGLTISKLKNGDMYVSVVRFNAPFGKDKSVAFKSRNSTLLASLYEVAHQITKVEEEENPIELLSKYLYTSSKNTNGDVSEIVIYDGADF